VDNFCKTLNSQERSVELILAQSNNSIERREESMRGKKPLAGLTGVFLVLLAQPQFHSHEKHLITTASLHPSNHPE
jgi:hypothetical protein